MLPVVTIPGVIAGRRARNDGRVAISRQSRRQHPLIFGVNADQGEFAAWSTGEAQGVRLGTLPREQCARADSASEIALGRGPPLARYWKSRNPARCINGLALSTYASNA